jgi:gamma-glutamyl:cysteine ligase YbdK (ATP-grasp superfamily)
MSSALSTLPAFAGYGIELEYMIVDAGDLSIRPFADRLLQQAAGKLCNDVERGMLGWSNEMTMHVIELKNLRPSASLQALPKAMQTEVRTLNRMLETMGARLMPSAMHPWMNPREETHVWPHDNAALYAAYTKIFDTETHGWSNLQSMHINLPFADDTQFARLHAAVRAALPMLPALAASSPIADGRNTGFADYRMEVYRSNADEIPSVAGALIPENAGSKAEYYDRILHPMYRDIAPHDPQSLLCHEWLNSRGAISRFDRNTIEIRVLDVQECPQADLAIAAASISLAKALYEERWSPTTAQAALSTSDLAAIFLDCIREGETALIGDAAYLELFGFPGTRCSAQELWSHCVERLQNDIAAIAGASAAETLQAILQHGTLARRILRAVGDDFSYTGLSAVYRTMCDCLQEGRMFLP